MIVKGIQIFCIIVLNLFAFLGVGHILDTLFGEKIFFKISALIFSIFPLIIFMYFFVKHSQKQIQDTYKKQTDGSDRNENN